MPHALEQDLNHVLACTEPLWREMNGERFFIAGGTGFVGTWLLESFVWAAEKLNLNAKAVVLTRNPEAFRKKAPAVCHSPGIELVRGNLTEHVNATGAFPFIIHAATETSFEATRDEPAGTFERDVIATRRLLEFASCCGAKRFLFTSSGAVYGKHPADLSHIPEDYPGAPSTTDPASAYGHAKRASEFLCSMYARQFGFAAVLARLFAFIGPHLPLDLNFAAGNFMRDVVGKHSIQIAGDGTPYRSYLYAADLAVWLWTLLFKGESSYPYNVGSDQEITIAELARKIARNTVPETPIYIAKEPVPGAAPARYVPSIQRARTELALQPLIPLDDAIRRMYEFERRAL